MTSRTTWMALGMLAVFGAAAVAGVLIGQLWIAVFAAVIIAAAFSTVALARARREQRPPDVVTGHLPGGPMDESRRRFLVAASASGLMAAGAGTAFGRALPDAIPMSATDAQNLMASNLGAGYMELVRRGFYPGRSGEVQLIVYPYNSANYPPESKSLVPDDPRSSHAAPWLYLERITLVLHAPGRFAPTTVEDRVTLADIAPTTAAITRSDFQAPDGRVLPGLTQAGMAPPKVVVTFVIDGGGWNVLHQWPDSWPNLKRLMTDGVNYTNAIHGSNPAVTACAHATIGTGAFPRTHGVSGHFIRFPDGSVEKAYGEDGQADTSVIEVPTFAEHWQEETGDRAWVGEIGYQIWHLGMIGRPRGYRGSKPIGVFYDEDVSGLWKPQNPDSYCLPSVVPPRTVLEGYLQNYTGPSEGADFTPKGGAYSCCSPPIVRYQGDLIAATLESEPVGQTEATSLLTINFKAPDYAGHIYNMQNPHEEAALREVDQQLGRLVADLDVRFGDDYVLIVTADHGQCPLVDDAGGVRLDPIQLENDIEQRFGQLVPAVQDVRPAEIYLERAALANDAGLPDALAAWLRTYTYGDNYFRYDDVPAAAIQRDQMSHLEFAATLSSTYLERLRTGLTVAPSFGPGVYGDITDTPVPL